MLPRRSPITATALIRLRAMWRPHNAGIRSYGGNVGGHDITGPA
jgi:hypothetical protein